MIDRLEKFEAPRSWHDLVPAAVLLLALIVVSNIDFHSSVTDSKVQAEATEKVIALPFAHPLGCPEEDEAGRPLKATLSIKGERRPRCYYSHAY